MNEWTTNMGTWPTWENSGGCLPAFDLGLHGGQREMQAYFLQEEQAQISVSDLCCSCPSGFWAMRGTDQGTPKPHRDQQDLTILLYPITNNVKPESASFGRNQRLSPDLLCPIVGKMLPVAPSSGQSWGLLTPCHRPWIQGLQKPPILVHLCSYTAQCSLHLQVYVSHAPWLMQDPCW